MAELVADGRQRAFLLQAEQEVHGAQRRSREDHARQVKRRGSRLNQAVDFTVRTS